jgi:hypothetical protein
MDTQHCFLNRLGADVKVHQCKPLVDLTKPTDIVYLVCPIGIHTVSPNNSTMHFTTGIIRTWMHKDTWLTFAPKTRAQKMGDKCDLIFTPKELFYNNETLIMDHKILAGVIAKLSQAQAQASAGWLT